MKKTINTILPLFPGFHNSGFDMEAAYCVAADVVNERREEKGLRPVLIPKVKFNDKKYRYDIITYSIEFVTNKLKEVYGIEVEIEIKGFVMLADHSMADDYCEVYVSIDIEDFKKFLMNNKSLVSAKIEDAFTISDDVLEPLFPTTFEGWYNRTEGFTEFNNNDFTDLELLGSLLDALLSDYKGEYVLYVMGMISFEDYVINYNKLI